MTTSVTLRSRSTVGSSLASPRRLSVTTTKTLSVNSDNRQVRRVLVVDDDADVTDLLSFMIENLGYEVCAANSGDNALALAETFRPNVVMLDLAMPGLDGFAVAQRLRAMSSCSGALLVAVTGSARTDLHERTIAAGFDCCFGKPITLAQLRELLSQRERALAPQ